MKNDKKITSLVFLLTLAITMGCDSPSSRRVVTSQQTATDGSNQDNSNPSSSGDGVEMPSGFQNCTSIAGGTYNSGNDSGNYLGPYNVCESTMDPRLIALQLKNSKSHRICVIPTTNSGLGTTYVGEPQCTQFSSPDHVAYINLINNRPGWSSYPITGLMILEDAPFQFPDPYNAQLLAPDAYLFCMDWLAQYWNTDFGSIYCDAYVNVHNQNNGIYLYHTL